MEAVINDYISRELVQGPALPPLANTASLLEACAYLGSGAGETAGQAVGHE